MIHSSKIALGPAQHRLRKQLLNPFLFRLMMFAKVPMAGIAAARIKSLSPEKAVSTLPFNFINKNPFKSVYFAVQSMAAELSTAVLVMLAIEGVRPSVAFIVTNMEAVFHKKATSNITFTCEDGEKVFEAVKACTQSSEPVVVRMKTEGRMADGTLVSTFYFEWSMKQRKR